MSSEGALLDLVELALGQGISHDRYYLRKRFSLQMRLPLVIPVEPDKEESS